MGIRARYERDSCHIWLPKEVWVKYDFDAGSASEDIGVDKILLSYESGLFVPCEP
jgi:hypothetical protein